MHELSVIRLLRVGPPRAPFADETLDLRISSTTSLLPAERRKAHAGYAGSLILLEGLNGSGKTTLARLVGMVLALHDSHRTGRKWAALAPQDGVGHVLLEWHDRDSGQRLVTGLALKRSGFPLTVGHYSFQPKDDTELRDISLDESPSDLEHTREQLERVARHAQLGGNFIFTTDSKVWSDHLATLGLNADSVHVSGEEEAGSPFHLSTQWIDRTDKFVEELIRRTVPPSDITKLADLCGEHRRKPTVDVVVTYAAELVRACLEDLQSLETLSAVPDQSGDMVHPLVRCAFNMPSIDQIRERIRAVVASRLPVRREREFPLLVNAITAATEGKIRISLLADDDAEATYATLDSFHRARGGRQAFTLALVDLLLTRVRNSRRQRKVGAGVIFLDLLQPPSGLHRQADVIRAWGLQVICLSANLSVSEIGAFDAIYNLLPGADYSPGNVTKILPATTLESLLATSSMEADAVDRLTYVMLSEVFDVLPSSAYPEPGDLVVPVLRRAGSANNVSIVEGKEWRYRVRDASLLRPRRPLERGEDRFYASYLGGDSVLKGGTYVGQLIALRPEDLAGLRIPRPDRETLRAITELTEAVATFGQWQQEALRSVNSFFASQDLAAARANIIATGRLTRQRRETAHVLDEQASRIRATMPYPIASRWRAVEAARLDESGYRRILDCAEVVVTYCAAMGVQFSIAHNLPIPNLQALSSKLRQGVPLPLGTWTAILAGLASAAATPGLPADSPLANYNHFSGRAIEAVKALKQRRNDLSHGRGPANHEIAPHAQAARNDLEILVAAAEWIVDYPLRYLEEARWDSFTNVTAVSFRELMGDHNVVGLKSDETPGNVEVFSPYVADQFARYYLLRPLFHSGYCADCGQLTLFVLDRWVTADQQAEYKALDHSDVCLLPVAAGLRAVGLLPA